MSEDIHDSFEKLDLITKIQIEKLKLRTKILNTFIPDKPEAVPFPEQIRFFKDKSLYRLLRCGNRGAKTFSTMRELAWMLTRTHPYKQEWNVFDLKDKNWRKKLDTLEYEERYLKTKATIGWIVSVSFDFIQNTMYGMYLKNMIPEWHISEIKYTNQKNLEKIVFRNGDVVQTRTYMQSESSKMGASLEYVITDEMSNDIKDITELVVRTFDKSGSVTLAFTPLVQNDEIRNYLDSGCENGDISLHSWSVLANPHYGQNPERKARVLAEYSHLSENERNSRLKGDWYYSTPGEAVFAGIEPEIVEDFEIPHHWRRMRVTDPAARVTGHAEFCEDPATGNWYLYRGLELSWKEAVKAEVLVATIESFKPYKDFKFCKSIYDNAELWYHPYAASAGYRPCILKNREEAIMKTRDIIATGKLKFFRNAGKFALKQFMEYHYNSKGDSVVKAKDHVLDCIMYFAREYPAWENTQPVEELSERQYIMKMSMEQRNKQVRQASFGYVPQKYLQGFNRGRAR